jgi:hypothetical protein
VLDLDPVDIAGVPLLFQARFLLERMLLFLLDALMDLVVAEVVEVGQHDDENVAMALQRGNPTTF